MGFYQPDKINLQNGIVESVYSKRKMSKQLWQEEEQLSERRKEIFRIIENVNKTGYSPSKVKDIFEKVDNNPA